MLEAWNTGMTVYQVLWVRILFKLIWRYPECFTVKLNAIYVFVIDEIQKCKNLVHIIDNHLAQRIDQVKINIYFAFFYVININRTFRKFKKLANTRTLPPPLQVRRQVVTGRCLYEQNNLLGN